MNDPLNTYLLLLAFCAGTVVVIKLIVWSSENWDKHPLIARTTAFFITSNLLIAWSLS